MPDATRIARPLAAALVPACLLLAVLLPPAPWGATSIARADPFTPDAETDVPSSIGTETADAYIAVAVPTVEFLQASAELAITRSDDARLRAFARREIGTADDTRAAFAARDAAVARNAARDAASPTLDGLTPLAGLVAIPYGYVADATRALKPLVTQLPSADHERAIARAELARLSAQGGAAFDVSFADRQVTALDRLAALDKDFILNGDDPRLRTIAVHDLPKVRALAAALRRIARR